MKCVCGDSWEQLKQIAETRGCFFKNNTSEGSGFLKNRWVCPKIKAKAFHWERNLQVAISGHGDCCGYLWSFAFEMMNLSQRDSQQSSSEMHWVVLRAEQKLQVWAPEHYTLWHLLNHLFAAFNHFKQLFWSSFSNVCWHTLHRSLRFCVCLEISTFRVSTCTIPIYTLIFHIWHMPLNV